MSRTQGYLRSFVVTLLIGIILASGWWAIRGAGRGIITVQRLGVARIGDATPGRHQYWQAGAVVGPDGQNTIAMRTTIRTISVGRIQDQTTNYYWIGSYLSNGAFVQVGYAIPWYDHTAHWFYCMYDAQQQQGPCPMGPPRSAGDAGTWHTYGLRVSRSQGQPWIWTATMDDHPLGTLQINAGSTGVRTPSVYIEQSAFSPVSAANDLGQPEFRPAIEYQRRDDGALHPATLAYMAYSHADVCPPWGIQVRRPNDLVIGNGLACPESMTPLW